VVAPQSPPKSLQRITFADLYERICAALRGNRTAVVAEIFRPDGSSTIIRQPRKIL
jgi:hypothetical protein